MRPGLKSSQTELSCVGSSVGCCCSSICFFLTGPMLCKYVTKYAETYPELGWLPQIPLTSTLLLAVTNCGCHSPLCLPFLLGLVRRCTNTKMESKHNCNNVMVGLLETQICLICQFCYYANISDVICGQSRVIRRGIGFCPLEQRCPARLFSGSLYVLVNTFLSNYAFITIRDASH